MNRYQLAKIVDWAGTLDTRKRMQKVAYLLQVAGCPLGADFNLHHYGPYSQEVARLTDAMVQAHILDERAESNMVGQRFSYCLNEVARKNLADFEATPRGTVAAAELAPHEDLARRLFLADLKDLEYASTAVFFRKQGHEWVEAVEKMCRFKGLTPRGRVVERADELARQIAG
ncbi:hypothetical protein ACYOEI_16265 [Singulisphaera rosea]